MTYLGSTPIDAVHVGATAADALRAGATEVWSSAPEPETYTFDEEVLADEPVGFWPLNETSGTTAVDATGNGNDGTYAGSPALAAATVAGRSCPLFDGVDDRVTLPTINIGAGGTYSIETIARADTIVSEAEVLSEILTGGTDGILASIGIKIGTATTPGQITAGSYSGDHIWPPWSWYVCEASTWTPGDTHHLVYTHDGSTGRFYVDGLLVDSVAFAVFNSNSGWRIGVKYDGTTFWNGPIAAAALYDTVLTSDRIATHYASLDL